MSKDTGKDASNVGKDADQDAGRVPWITYSHIWNTEAKWWSWLRGNIRRAVWNRSPVKLEAIKLKRIRILNERTGNEVWGGRCNICQQEYLLKDLQVDHVTGGHSLRSVEDISTFVQAMVFVAPEDLQLVCKPCHKQKTLEERRAAKQARAGVK